MNGGTQVWIVAHGSYEPRMLPLRDARDQEFFATEAEAFDFIVEREMEEARRKTSAATEAQKRADSATRKAASIRATEAARGTPK